MARPKKTIDYKTVKGLAEIFCTQEEIATVLELSVSTLQRDPEFCSIYKKGLEGAKQSLRRKQLKLAETNATMAIFLGKNYLGQRDYKENDIDDRKPYTADFNFTIINASKK